MKNKIRSFSMVTVMALAALILTFTACTKPVREYSGDAYDLYTVALYSVIGAGEAHIDNSNYIANPINDDYGRTLFFIGTRYPSVLAGNKPVYALCICQKSELSGRSSLVPDIMDYIPDTYTYYYEDVCAVPCDENGLVDKDVMRKFLTENDWNKPLDESRMKKALIVKTAQAAGHDFDDKYSYWHALEDFVPAEADYMEKQILSVDNQGRQLVVMRSSTYDYQPIGSTIAAVIEPYRQDGQGRSIEPKVTGYVELTDDVLLDYTDTIIQLKADNHWDEPFVTLPMYTLPDNK